MPSSDVAADHMSSSDSLSLTGLVCIQEQYSKSKPAASQALEPRHHRKTTKVSENDINFEFSYSAQSPVAGNLHKKSQSKDLFDLKPIHLQPQAYGNVTMKDILEPCNNRSRKSGSKKEVGNSISTKKTNTQVSKYGGTKDKNGFAHKLMQSITTPCRSCSAVEPTVAVKRSNMVQDI
ncbi:hypothetical protein L6452_30966 [Arctium lappa]|uniref:Uncharacterized protein n=1 Tax=Arctium lappa TaxID=4217 RepID=A0ACB8ZIN0_ARCLA|nr:hypothetical protein L6452_30966 [Arctium lappa]